MAGMVTSQTFTPFDHLSREVQIDRDEFLRQLPGAIGGRAFSVDGDIITVPEGGGQVRIRLTPLTGKHLGPLDLPMMRIDFDFNGLWDEEVVHGRLRSADPSRRWRHVIHIGRNRFLPPQLPPVRD